MEKLSPPEALLWKDIPIIWSKFTGIYLYKSVSTIKILVPHGCFPVNLQRVFWPSSYKNTRGDFSWTEKISKNVPKVLNCVIDYIMSWGIETLQKLQYITQSCRQKIFREMNRRQRTAGSYNNVRLLLRVLKKTIFNVCALTANSKMTSVSSVYVRTQCTQLLQPCLMIIRIIPGYKLQQNYWNCKSAIPICAPQMFLQINHNTCMKRIHGAD